MKIRFNDGMEYEVFSVAYQLDENDVPIDIVIYGTKEALEQIAEYASIGVNIQECDLVSDMPNALYARLQPFTVIEADRVQYTASVN